MKLTINRESPVPLHDQLVTQIALLIAGGLLAGGERLPSIRDLARRLDVHHNTISSVYKSLETYGVVTVRQGSGVRVIEHSGPGAARADGMPTLATLAAGWVAEARALGHDDGAISAAIAEALHPAPVTHLVVIDPHPDFHALYLHELGALLALPLRPMTFDEVAREGRSALDGAVVLTSLYHLAPVRSLVGDHAPLIVFQVSAGQDILAEIRTLPAGSTLGLVSVSETMLGLAREVVAGMRGDELLIIEAAPDDAERLRSVVKLSDALCTDGPSADRVRALTPKPAYTLQLVPQAALADLAAKLPAEALRAEWAAPNASGP